MAEKIEVIRIIVYTGPKEWVEDVLDKSLMTVHKGRVDFTTHHGNATIKCLYEMRKEQDNGV